jgi:tetrahydromethanopterin S-methyltransferase subunit B
MSDMSFKQAKELVERLELTEISIKKTVTELDETTNRLNQALKQQEILTSFIPKQNRKAGILQLLIGINLGFIIGVIVYKLFLG